MPRSPTAPAFGARHPVEINEETEDELAVIADALQQVGDPLGDLINTQLALEHLPEDAPNARRGALDRKLAALLDTHHDSLFGALAPHVPRVSRPDLIDPAIEIKRWRSGFADAVALRATLHGPQLDEVYRRMRALPILRRVRVASIGVGLGPAFATAIVADPPPRLRELSLKPAPWRSQPEEGLPDLEPLVPLCGQLEVLRIERRMTVPPLRSVTLRELGYVMQRDGEPFATSELPRLAELSLSGGTIEPGFCERFPALERLRLYSTTFADAFLVQLFTSSAIVRMRELGIGVGFDGRHRDILELVARHADRLAHLEELTLSGVFQRELVAAYRPRLPRCVKIT